MDNDGVDANIFEEDDVKGEVFFQPLFFNRASPILDHNGFVIKPTDIRKRFN